MLGRLVVLMGLVILRFEVVLRLEAELKVLIVLIVKVAFDQGSVIVGIDTELLDEV